MLWIELVVLIVQFALGMYLNLFAALPPSVGGMHGMMQLMFGSGAPALAGHMVTGMTLGLLALLAVVVAAISGDKPLVASTGVAFASVAGAGIGGMEFLFLGQNNVYSYGMAIGFILAIAFTFLSLLLVTRRPG